jgi:hypothetical protein
MLGALLVGALVGAVLVLVGPEGASDPVPSVVLPRTGEVEVDIVDRSGTNPPLAPPTLTLEVGSERIVIEQSATPGGLRTGLRWREDVPLVLDYVSADPEAEPGLRTALDMAGGSGTIGAEPGGMLSVAVRVTIEPDATLVRVVLDDVVLLDESLPRADRRGLLEAALQACELEVEGEVGTVLTALGALEERIDSFYGRSRAYPEWVREVDEAIGLLDVLQDTFDDAGPALDSLTRGRAWHADADDALSTLGSDLRALRSASAASSDPRFQEAFGRMSTTMVDRVAPLRTTLDPELWCAAG